MKKATRITLIVVAVAITLGAGTGVVLRQPWKSPSGQHLDEPDILEYELEVTVSVQEPGEEYLEFWAESDLFTQGCSREWPYKPGEYHCWTSEQNGTPMGGKRLGDDKCSLEGLVMTCEPRYDNPVNKYWSPDFTVTFEYTSDPIANPSPTYRGSSG